MQRLRDAIFNLAESNQPCTVRQIYYLGIGRYWEKDTGGSRKNYRDVVRLTGELREADELPWGWIADNTRWVRIPTMFNSKEDALARWAEAYRRDLWASQSRHVEVWCESDSIAGVLTNVTRPMGVGLYVCRGQASKTFVHEAIESYRHIGKPVSIVYVGDWDPTGLAIPFSLEDRMARYSGNGAGFLEGLSFDEIDRVIDNANRVGVEVGEVHLERVAVTPDDVRSGELVTHEVNSRDPNYRRFAETCRLVDLGPQTAVEVEAVPPDQLRNRVGAALEDLTDDPEAWNATVEAERSEREILRRLAGGDVSTWEVSA